MSQCFVWANGSEGAIITGHWAFVHLTRPAPAFSFSTPTFFGHQRASTKGSARALFWGWFFLPPPPPQLSGIIYVCMSVAVIQGDTGNTAGSEEGTGTPMYGIL
jgi:hypothetical protein